MYGEPQLGTFTVASGKQDLLWNLCDRDDLGQASGEGAGSGHPINGTGGFVLAESDAAAAMDRCHANDTIRTHARHDDAHGAGAKLFCQREHQNVHRRVVELASRIVAQQNPGVCVIGALDRHVES